MKSRPANAHLFLIIFARLLPARLEGPLVRAVRRGL
jgi:hypothetical protein